MAGHGIWMPIYWADYFADTTHLTTFQHGAYLLLIGAYWRRGGPIPADPASVAQMARTTNDKVARYLKPVLAMFTCKDGLLYHERIEKELLRSCERISDSKAAAHARWMRKDMLITTTITKERKTRARAQPNGNGIDAHALSPKEVEELKDRTDRIMKRGKYAEKFS